MTNLCFLRNTEYADGKKIGGDCANWIISCYGVSKSTSKLNNHLIIHHKEKYEAYNSLKAVTAVLAVNNGFSLGLRLEVQWILYHEVNRFKKSNLKAKSSLRSEGGPFLNRISGKKLRT